MSSLPLLVSAPLSELPLDEPSLRAVLVCLLGEFECAHCLGRPVWDFSVSLPRLQKTGLLDAVLQGLIAAGHLEHRIEQARPRAQPPTVRQATGSRWHKHSSFALTESGADLARQVLQDSREGSANEDSAICLSCATAESESPYWDAAVRDLWHRRRLVKHFRRVAPNQEYLLAALQEIGWPARIDDPLPQDAEVDAQDRLRDTVKSLNRSQKPRIIHFEVEVTGEGVRWRVVG